MTRRFRKGFLSRFLLVVGVLLAPLALAAGDEPGPVVVGSGEVPVVQPVKGVEMLDEPVWLAPILGPARLVYLTTYGGHAEPFQITRVFSAGTGLYKFPDANGVAQYRQFRTIEQEAQTTVDYLGKPLQQCQSVRRWFDAGTKEVVRIEFAATSGAPPNFFTAEAAGPVLRLTYRLLPGEDPEKPEGGETVNELPIPPGGFMPLDLQFAVDHLKTWGWPVGEARRFTVFVVEEGAYRTWRLERLANEKLDLPHLPHFDTLCFRMVSGPAPNAPGYADWMPEKSRDLAQRFWVNPFTGELLRSVTPGPAGGAARAAGDLDPEETRSEVSYETTAAPVLKARRVTAPELTPRALARLAALPPADYAIVVSKKQVGDVHFHFEAFTPPAAPLAGGDNPGAPAGAAAMVTEVSHRSVARLTLNAGQGERKETAETWYLPDGRVRRMLISGERTLQNTMAYVQEIYCVGDIFSTTGLRIERVPCEARDAKPGTLVDGAKSRWSRAHVRDANLRVFDTNRLEQFLALCEQVELREQPDWRVGVYQIQSDTPQIMTGHLERLTGPAALSQFAAALTVPTRVDTEADAYARRTDIELVAVHGDPVADPNASEWRRRLAAGEAAIWQLTLSGPGQSIFAYFGAGHKLYAVIQRERDGRELRWVLIPAPDKRLAPAVNPPRVIYPHDW